MFLNVIGLPHGAPSQNRYEPKLPLKPTFFKKKLDDVIMRRIDGR